jgi:hypothetical protein
MSIMISLPSSLLTRQPMSATKNAASRRGFGVCIVK